MTHVRLGPEVEDVCNAEVERLRVGVWVLEPRGAVQIDVLDEQRVEGVDVPHQHLEVLQETHESEPSGASNDGI